MTLMDSKEFQGPINLGNDQEVSISYLAKTIKELTGSQSEILCLDKSPGDPKRRKPDLSLALGQLKWQARTSLQTGLKKTSSYFQKLKK